MSRSRIRPHSDDVVNACPLCEARVGRPCTNPRGLPLPGGRVHVARLRAAEPLPDPADAVVMTCPLVTVGDVAALEEAGIFDAWWRDMGRSLHALARVRKGAESAS